MPSIVQQDIGGVRAVTTRGWRYALFLRGLYTRPASAVGTTITIIFLLVALLGPSLAPYGANQIIAQDVRQSPSASHWFGTDHLGRDVFSRVILGAREILAMSGTGTLLAVVAGTLLGLLSGYKGDWFDEIVMRFFDSLLSVPALLFALLLLGILGPSNKSVLVVIVVVYTPIVARVVRSVVISVKTKGFVEAARLQGESLGSILLREILPSVLPAPPGISVPHPVDHLFDHFRRDPMVAGRRLPCHPGT